MSKDPMVKQSVDWIAVAGVEMSKDLVAKQSVV